MSKQHLANRRRSYGRRQHELHQRFERPVGFLGWIEVGESVDAKNRSELDRFGSADARDRFVAQSAD
jgi:hypothetical protein